MELPDEVTEDVRRRLHRAAGQIAGVERMLDEGRACTELVTQLRAVTKALEQARSRVVVAGLTYCIEHRGETEGGRPIEEVERLLTKLT